MLTVIAFLVCNTYIPPTLGTSPLIFLFLKPFLCADLFYPQQVINKAYVIVANMTLIELLKISTRKILVFKTKRHLFLSNQFAVFFDPGAVFILYSAAFAAPFQVSFF